MKIRGMIKRFLEIVLYAIYAAIGVTLIVPALIYIISGINYADINWVDDVLDFLFP